MNKKIQEAVAYIHSKTHFIPEIAIILGSGLAKIADDIEVAATFDYGSTPYFPIPTVEGHHGKLIMGTLAGKKVVVMQGRIHYYEGFSMEDVTFPVRVMKILGANSIIICSAAGGLNPDYKTGDLMIINDHINLTGDNPLRGQNDDTLGPRFPDQHNVYDKNLIAQATQIANSHKITCHAGVYAGIAGPTLETPAEYRYLRIAGGDAVGMSTVPEVIVANHMGMKIFALCVITNKVIQQ
jgi:purine-nucleoside phosphorylase